MVIVTGLSGAGKTQALRHLEDMGYFCVDNLPPTLIPKFAELCAQTNRGISNMALVVDIRGGEFFQALSEVLEQLKQYGIKYEILYLEASDDVLVRRYKESRRRHPLDTHGEVLPNIHEERMLLAEIRGQADKIIDTSNLKSQELKDKLIDLFSSETASSQLLISVISFGFKYGIPLDSDLVIDVRFLPNPFYDPAMRPLSGNEPVVRDFVFNSPVTIEFMEKFTDLVEFLIPRYIDEGKTTLMIAIGCTGGMHRSVALANRLGEILQNKEYRVAVIHRDINRVS
ncbi:glmZ(sRNA)-inactivating NTPase [Sporotomaculum syntrophicum]|uniref:GlmZ(SRNA)-inactivating NTPase n=1 Tax=Sporotomaculum syntrophicum TaxID=182264 RepID=A0A9D2WS58_9FIRM|nr:RNase adapter RapZ [Sporotomaculum syntrophicum]KAF1086135.1 glmZ(sRNA)-inactivating NTPase [Sporotomaculum syntrophicum]